MTTTSTPSDIIAAFDRLTPAEQNSLVDALILRVKDVAPDTVLPLHGPNAAFAVAVFGTLTAQQYRSYSYMLNLLWEHVKAGYTLDDYSDRCRKVVLFTAACDYTIGSRKVVHSGFRRAARTLTGVVHSGGCSREDFLREIIEPDDKPLHTECTVDGETLTVELLTKLCNEQKHDDPSSDTTDINMPD